MGLRRMVRQVRHARHQPDPLARQCPHPGGDSFRLASDFAEAVPGHTNRSATWPGLKRASGETRTVRVAVEERCAPTLAAGQNVTMAALTRMTRFSVAFISVNQSIYTKGLEGNTEEDTPAYRIEQ